MVLKACEDIEGWDQKLRDRFVPIYGRDLQKVWSNLVRSVKNGNIIGKPRVHEINCRTLVIQGPADFIDKNEVRFLVDKIKGCEFYQMSQGAHDCHIEYYQEFNRRVEKFLSGFI